MFFCFKKNKKIFDKKEEKQNYIANKQLNIVFKVGKNGKVNLFARMAGRP